MWPLWLAIGGTAMQLVGLSLLIYELGLVSARERDVEPWWELLWQLIRSQFRQPKPAPSTPRGIISPTFVLRADGTVTPREPASDDPAEVWIAWLRARLDYLQSRLEETRARQTRDRGEIEAKISSTAADLEKWLSSSEEREAERRTERARSANRQGWGTLLVIAGVIATGIGAALGAAA